MFLQPLARQGTAGRDASSARAGRGGKTRLQFTREKRKEKKKDKKKQHTARYLMMQCMSMNTVCIPCILRHNDSLSETAVEQLLPVLLLLGTCKLPPNPFCLWGAIAPPLPLQPKPRSSCPHNGRAGGANPC